MLYGGCVDSICILHNSQRENHKVIRWWKKSILRPFSSLLNFGWECNHLVQLLVSQFCTNHVLQAIQVTYPRQCHPSGCGPHFLELQHYYRASVECLHCPLLQDYDSLSESWTSPQTQPQAGQSVFKLKSLVGSVSLGCVMSWGGLNSINKQKQTKTGFRTQNLTKLKVYAFQRILHRPWLGHVFISWEFSTHCLTSGCHSLFQVF